jgi:hypothetical protein
VLHELRGRVKVARAVVATTPGLADTLARDWQKAPLFYARFEITESQFWHGIPSNHMKEAEAGRDVTPSESLMFPDEVA